MMRKYEATCDDLYLTKDEINLLLDGLHYSLEAHYDQFEKDLPEDQVLLVNKLIEIKRKFKYCSKCRDFYYERWSNSECRNCPTEEEQ